MQMEKSSENLASRKACKYGRITAFYFTCAAFKCTRFSQSRKARLGMRKEENEGRRELRATVGRRSTLGTAAACAVQACKVIQGHTLGGLGRPEKPSWF